MLVLDYLFSISIQLCNDPFVNYQYTINKIDIFYFYFFVFMAKYYENFSILRTQPCTTNALFEFTWCLYICVKGEHHRSAHDLVDMYHLLLASLDFVFANAFMDRRVDLINPAFKGLFTKLLSIF